MSSRDDKFSPAQYNDEKLNDNPEDLVVKTRVIHVERTQKDSPLAEVLLLERPKFFSWINFRLFAVLFVSYLCNAQNGFGERNRLLSDFCLFLSP